MLIIWLSLLMQVLRLLGRSGAVPFVGLRAPMLSFQPCEAWVRLKLFNQRHDIIFVVPLKLVWQFSSVASSLSAMATHPPASCEKRDSAVEGLAKNPLHDKGPTDGTDSGYGSLGSTVDVESSELGEFELEHKVSRRLFSRSKKTKLRPFNQEISKAVQDRFSDLTELFGPSLYSFLAKKRVVYNAISIKLKVLGKDERSAKPWVIVQCDVSASKSIKNFFDQPEVKSQYRAGDSEPDLPSFEVVIHPRAPVSLATSDLTSVYGKSWAAVDTLCGRIIKIGNLDEPRIATLGGVIEVENSPGEFVLHGLTAGHILTKEPAIRHGNRRESPSTNMAAYNSCETAPTHLKSELQKVDDDLAHDSGHSQEQEDGDFAIGCERDEEEFEIDLAVDIDKATEGPTSFQDPSLDLTTQGSHQQSWSKIGIISQTSRGMLGIMRLGPDHIIGPDYDWALVSIAPDLYQPNLLAGQPDMELTELSGEVHRSEGSRAVVLASDIGGLKHGTLSFSPSFLMQGQAKLFTKTYTLLLHDVPGTIVALGFGTVHIHC